MTELERLTEKIRYAMLWGWTEPSEIAERLIEDGDVIVTPCKVGDVVWCVLEDHPSEGDWFISEEHVTDVSARGIWLSAFAPPKDDHGNFIPWEQVGVDIFTTHEEAEAALAERINRQNGATQGSFDTKCAESCIYNRKTEVIS